MFSAFLSLIILLLPAVGARQASLKYLDGVIIQGTVLSADGKLVSGAVVSLEKDEPPGTAQTQTNEAGTFSFAFLSTGRYRLSAAKSGLRSHTIAVVASSENVTAKIDLVLQLTGLAPEPSSFSVPASQTLEFTDKPDFTVAGVVDWTAVGGHGSDSTLRTSESLASQTFTLKADGAARGASSASDDQKNADLHRLAAERDEKLGDSLTAVHEYEQAVRLDPSEQNYFEWGSELLLHRAVWEAQEVFRKGVDAYPKSARMQIALGTALFAGARYDEAAQRLCDASDLNPADPTPYVFMGKIQMAAPNPLACVESKLARFVHQQPGSSVANYLYAMSILKHPRKQAVPQAEALLTKAVGIDSQCGEAYLQLGIIAASQRDFIKAIRFYTKAIEADPQLADAHYRLGVAYDRVNQPAKSKQEFQLHDKIRQQQAAAAEQQRRQVKQFLVVQPSRGPGPAVN